MTQDAILGSYWTLAAGTAPVIQEVCEFDFIERVGAAAAAGYTGMGLWHSDLEAVCRKYPLADVARILADNGIVHIELEWLNDWFYDPADPRRAASDHYRRQLLDAASVLGASHIKVADLGNETVPLDGVAEAFSVLCAEAADHGTNILFEMLPGAFSNLPGIANVLAMIRSSGARNGGIMIDNLHVERTGTTLSDLHTLLSDADCPIGVEINDGALVQPVDFVDSVIARRLLPGDGEFDISGFLVAMWDIGFAGPIGVEVMNEYFRPWPLRTMAEISYAKTEAQVRAARQSFELRGTPQDIENKETQA